MPAVVAASYAVEANLSTERVASARTWVAVIGATLGAFMAVLNIQIVNASLADIQGAIGAGIDDGGWISTAYLIAEIVVIPLTGWLAKAFSLRRYLLVNAVLFLFFSAACAFAANLGQMIALRAVQGFCGGVLIPLSFTLIITLLPKSKQPIGLALFALSATVAPAVGPTIGGYLTENWGWQYIFYVNLVPGALMVGLLWWSLESGPTQLGVLREGDWAGIFTMAIGLAALQTALEEGNKEDWFGSPFIVRLTGVAVVALTLFIWIELRAEKPLLNLRLLARRNFGFGILANFLLGVALYGSVFVLPQYLARVQGYNSEQIGAVLAWTGLPQLLLIPLVPRLMKHIDARPLICAGFTLFAGSNFMNIWMTADYAADQLFWPNVVRALGQALVFAPLSAVATAGIEEENAASASALFNMVRNLGGAIGIAALQTFLTKREQYHSNVLTNLVSPLDEITRTRILNLTAYFLRHGVSDTALATHKAVVAIGSRIHREAFVMAFSDAFFLLGSSLVLALIAALFLKGSAAAASTSRSAPVSSSGLTSAKRDQGRWIPSVVAVSVLTLLLHPSTAEAHVKWFAPYIVGAPPAPVTQTIFDGWFWAGIALVLIFFVATRKLELTSHGEAVLDALDRLTDPLWRRLDDYVRAIVAAFFVAIFSVGGIYLTPDLKTPAEWVSWFQLVIAAAIFWRATMPLAAAGIIILWLLALRDYDLFHLFDYLAIGVGVSAYLVLCSIKDENWRSQRFEALRWGLAIALMWSSLEKFAYPGWFFPLVVEKPFLTFGLPRDAFIPMAGVAEFTLGFGLIWTPLIRRLSAAALFVIFTAAVWPFGRIEIIGHGLIMAILLAVACDHSRKSYIFRRLKAPASSIPVGIAAALALFISSYWGLHLAFYGPNGHVGSVAAGMSTHSYSPEHPHGPEAEGTIGAPPTRGLK